MDIMKSKIYYSILPLIGSVFTLIGLLIPAWVSITSFGENVWMVGIVEHIFTYESSFSLMPIEFILPNIISTIIIGSLSLFTIGTLVYYLKGKNFKIKYELFWLLVGCAKILTMVIYIISFDISFSNYLVETNYFITNFWEIYTYSFGLIVPFISSSLLILGATLKYWNPFRK